MEEHPSQTEIIERMFNELLLDRKHERRKTYIKYGVIAALGVAYLGALAVGVVRNMDMEAITSNGHLAVVKVTGEIMPGKEASAAVLNPLLDKAFSDGNAKAVVLLINSPGGTPVQSSLIHDHIIRLKRANPGKKVYAIGEDMMTSGAYMIAVAADSIIVNRSTLAGSIGVISRGFGFTGLMDKMGVERRVATAGEAKNMLDPFVPQTQADRDKLHELLSDIHGHFIDTVKQGRGGRLDPETPGIFSGTAWTGEQAVALGLADSLGGIDIVKQEYDVSAVREYSPPRSLMDIVVNGVSSKALELFSGTPELPLAIFE